MWNDFWLCFVPLFFAVDAVGVLPMFISLTEGFQKQEVRQVIVQSLLTAVIVSVAFVFLGQSIFDYLGITTSDFMIAGGVVLFIISLRDILNSEKKQRKVDLGSLGAVPIGVPLIVGPAVLTTSLLLLAQYGYVLLLTSLLVNILIACLVFYFSLPLNKLLGKAGSKTISKIFALIIAALAVMMIRKGITSIPW
ncbi:MAG: MarC family protein [Spirochaetales bacterium]|nr:MarC family protein [Spirochaetales bacterium]